MAGILAATLAPGEVDPRATPMVRETLALGDRIRNLLLFAPLGVALAWRGFAWGRAAAVASAVSAFAELAQLAIPGRDPSVADWLCNTGGAALGVALYRLAPRWHRPTASGARWLALLAGLAASGLLVAASGLMRPAPTAATPYYGLHVPHLSHLAPYRGARVTRARLDEIEIPPTSIAGTDRLRGRLGEDHTLQVDVRAGFAPDSLAPILSVTDAMQREILTLGAERDDLVYRYRSVGSGLGLEPTPARLPGALGGTRPGEALRLVVERRRGDLCLAAASVAACERGPTLGSSWMLIVPDHRELARWRPLLGAGWIAALFLPLGYWSRWNAASGAAWTIAAAALGVAPTLAALRTTPVSEWTGAALGLGAGLALAIAARRADRDAATRRVDRS